jgi:hypothetical protein
MKSKRVGAGAAVLAMTVLAVGLASAPASARPQLATEVHVVRTSPDQPTAGMNNTVWFELVHNGKGGWPIMAIDCRAMAGGKKAQLVDKGIDGTLAHCTWFIPRRAKGKTIDGVIAAQAQSGTWYSAGFDANIV